MVHVKNDHTGDTDPARKERSIGYVYGTGFFLAGIALVLGSHIIHEAEGTIAHSLRFLGETLGVAFIALGILNILIEMKDWRNYFERRLQEIVVNQSYLQQLDKGRLAALQTNIMKVFFKDQNIDREGSFLSYFDVHLHKFIAEPFREDVTAEVFLNEEGPDKWHVFDKVTYRCRRAAGTIQRDVKWVEDPGELDVKALKLEITYPADHHEKPSHKEVLADTAADKKMFASFRTGVSLNDYEDVDGLVVSLEATYIVPRERFQYWTMAHPTKNFDITIKFPAGFTIQRKSFVINEGQMLITENDGYLRAKYDSWLLPTGGVAWRVCSPLVSATGGSPLGDAENMANLINAGAAARRT